MSVTLGDLAERHGCALRGDPAIRVSRVATLEDAAPDAISFLANPNYKRFLSETRAAAVILSPADADLCRVAALVTDNPYLAYARVATELNPPTGFTPGVSRDATIESGVSIAATAYVGPASVIDQDAVVGDGSSIGPGCVIGRDVVIGRDCVLVSGVTLCRGVQIGDRVVIHPGVVIGADGFGIAKDGDAWVKVPQLGAVRIGDDVEIGANTTIDRGAIGDTIVGSGVKLDNQIQIGHNVYIGEHTVIAGCVGVSGSTKIGRRCMIAGATGIAGHLEIADDVVLLAASVVLSSIPEAGVYGSTLMHDEARRWRRNATRFRQLDEMAKNIRMLERRLKAMERETENEDD